MEVWARVLWPLWRPVVVAADSLPRGGAGGAIQYTTASRIPKPLSEKNGTKTEVATDARVFCLLDFPKCNKHLFRHNAGSEDFRIPLKLSINVNRLP